jgi:glycosyltransferase involved in cell wall biosynthesis
MWKDSMPDEIKNSAIYNRIHIVGRVNDTELHVIIASALAMCYVPFFEGFGIPLVEAMACGVPVITSNCTSMPEVVADAALLVNPSEPQEIYSALVQICTDTNLRFTLMDKGLLRVKTFSWDESACLYWESVQKIL